MSIKEIEKKIIGQAETEAAKIKQQVEAEIKQLESVLEQEVAKIKSTSLRLAQQKAESLKLSIIVPARLQAKKDLLVEKQRIITDIYSEVQTEKKLSTAELEQIREKTEVKVGQVLFG